MKAGCRSLGVGERLCGVGAVTHFLQRITASLIALGVIADTLSRFHLSARYAEGGVKRNLDEPQIKLKAVNDVSAKFDMRS
jgi:hypothetical protein